MCRKLFLPKILIQSCVDYIKILQIREIYQTGVEKSQTIPLERNVIVKTGNVKGREDKIEIPEKYRLVRIN